MPICGITSSRHNEISPVVERRLGMTISEVLRQVVIDSGLSHYRVAKMAGTTPTIIGRFVNEQKGLRLSTADRLAEAMGLELKPIKTARTRSN